MSQQIDANRGQRFSKLPPRYTPIVFAFFMSAIMALLMCMVITAVNQGVGSGFFERSFHAYRLAMPVAFFCVLLVRPVVIRLVKLTVQT